MGFSADCSGWRRAEFPSPYWGQAASLPMPPTSQGSASPGRTGPSGPAGRVEFPPRPLALGGVGEDPQPDLVPGEQPLGRNVGTVVLGADAVGVPVEVVHSLEGSPQSLQV